jgi:phosphatidylglycerophosphate synthase
LSKAEWQERARTLLSPLVKMLARTGITPTALTLFGLALHVICGIVVALGMLAAGGFLLLIAAVCDGLDGALARRTGQVSRFGAFLDSTVDRIDETMVLGGVAAYFLLRGDASGVVWNVVALLGLAGSLITSYTRARAEGLGLECKVGVFERPERVVLTVLGLLLGSRVLGPAIALLAFLSWITVIQRILHVRRLLATEAPPAAARRRPVPRRSRQGTPESPD